MVSEVSLALVLLICAGLTSRASPRMQQSNPGFQADHVLTMEMELPTDTKYASPGAGRLLPRLLDRLVQTPEIAAAGVTDVLPLDEQDMPIRDSPSKVRRPCPRRTLGADFRSVSAGYFAAMGIPAARRPPLHRSRPRRGAPGRDRR